MTDARARLYGTQALADVFSPRGHVGRLLAFEAALARAEARCGVIPAAAATAITAACHLQGLDLDALYEGATKSGTPIVPLLAALEPRVGAEGRDHLHRGATSQDAVDTALVLQMRDGLALIEADLERICVASAALARRHRHTPMAGRTLLQQAVPIPFGLKAARWLALAGRQRRALEIARIGTLVLQFGGAAGTLAVLGDRGLAVAENLAADLQLRLPDLPWHAERDRPASIVATLGIAAGAMAKIANDIILLSQTEVGEVSEGGAAGVGGSSAMPQKKNPVLATFAVAAARLAMAQVPVALGAMVEEHERGAGGWQAEWSAIPDAFLFTGGAVSRVADALEHLHVDENRMAANMRAGLDVVYAEALATALTARLGKGDAQRIVGGLARDAVAAGRSLRDVAGHDVRVSAVLSPEALARVFDSDHTWGSAQAFIDRALDGA